MIFYFSGTGNSLQVAKNISEYNKEKLISIAAILNNQEGCYEYDLAQDEVVGFVFPIYAWAPPKMVLEFIEKLKLNNYNNHYVFSVATCGSNIGNTIKLLNKYLKRKNMNLNSGFSIKMPTNYIIMGDVEPEAIAKKKLVEAEETIKEINQTIKEKKRKMECLKLTKALFHSY